VLAYEPDESPARPGGPPPAGRPGPAAGWTASPDLEVLDAARFRLSPRDASPVTDPSLVRTLGDIQAVARVRRAARYGAGPPPGPVDLGASLVLAGNLRLHLDALEADLLDAAERLGVSWDVIAAITGLPADDARRRLAELRARPDPR
jgi:hypothetical protein